MLSASESNEPKATDTLDPPSHIDPLFSFKQCRVKDKKELPILYKGLSLAICPLFSCDSMVIMPVDKVTLKNSNCFIFRKTVYA